MFLDFHTHTAYQKENTQSIYNVIWGKDTGDWKNMKSVSIGIHPWYLNTEKANEWLEEIRVASTLPQVKLIGETGLDKIRGADWETQEKVFKEHIQIAEEVKKPLILHCVRAYNEALAMLKEMKVSVPIVFHGFSRKYGLALQLTNQGHYLSFGENLLNRVHIQESLAQIPTNLMFFETDDSENLVIERIYEKAAEIKGISVAELRKIIQENYSRLLNE